MRGSRSDARRRRHVRVRKRLRGSVDQPRLAVFRSNRYIYAQVIDDTQGTTIAHASSVAESAAGNKVDVAKSVGSAVAKACIDKGVEQVVFDRGGFQYHGRLKALADAARKEGLKF